jgi:ATP-dependent helicase/DNAse subunit B
MEKDYILGRAGAEPGLLRAFLMAERERTDRMAPAHFEVAFGQPGNRPANVDPRLSTPATVKIGEVNLRGRIDRIDVGEDCFTVTDYKTGSAVPTLSEIRSGMSLQLPLYLRAAEELLARNGMSLPPAAGFYYRVRDPVELALALGSARFSGEAFSAPRTTRRVLKTEAELEAIIDSAVQRANDYVDAMKAGGEGLPIL